MSRWREKYKVHPSADCFPMLSHDELQKLGEDIKANGLREAIYADSDGVILDGSNRLEGMERAGVPFELFGDDGMSFDVPIEGQEAVQFIISKNIHRRHLAKQQQAHLIVAAIKAGDGAKQKPTQVESVSTNVESLTRELEA